MKKIELIPTQELIAKYVELKSSYKVADFFGVCSWAVKRTLKREGALRTQSVAQKERDSSTRPVYVRTESHKQALSEHAKKRTGDKNPFFGKTHSEETKKRLMEATSARIGKLNPNYRHGKNIRRPRDFKTAEFSKIRSFVFNRDKHTCKITGQVGGHLHAHHLLPYWVCEAAFFDTDNIITVSTTAHFDVCHLKSWGSFNVAMIPDSLINKYGLDRERLSEMAALWQKR